MRLCTAFTCFRRLWWTSWEVLFSMEWVVWLVGWLARWIKWSINPQKEYLQTDLYTYLYIPVCCRHHATLWLIPNHMIHKIELCWWPANKYYVCTWRYHNISPYIIRKLKLLLHIIIGIPKMLASYIRTVNHSNKFKIIPD